jgi:hypothetical protein
LALTSTPTHQSGWANGGRIMHHAARSGGGPRLRTCRAPTATTDSLAANTHTCRRRRCSAVGLGASGAVYFGANLEFPGNPLSQSVRGGGVCGAARVTDVGCCQRQGRGDPPNGVLQVEPFNANTLNRRCTLSSF